MYRLRDGNITAFNCFDKMVITKTPVVYLEFILLTLL